MHVADLLHDEPDLAARAAKLRLDPESAFPILSAKVKLTWRCNLRCRMCTVWRRGAERGRKDLLAPETVEGVLTALAARGLRKVHFSGGEVLLVKSLPRLLDYSAGELGLQVNLTTNGTLLDKEAARLLVETRVHSVTVSIDSSEESWHDEMRGAKGAWRNAWKGIERLRERRERKGRGPRIGVNTVVASQNVAALGDLYDMLVERGVDRWRLLPIDTDDKRLRPTAEDWRKLSRRWEEWRTLLTRPPLDWSSERSAERAAKGKFAGVFYGGLTCYAPWFNVFIDADGLAYPCCMGKRRIRPYGNILDTPVEALLAGPRRREVLFSMAAGQTYDVCDQCDDFLEENEAFGGLSAREVEK